jgi:hypothetical protein
VHVPHFPTSPTSFLWVPDGKSSNTVLTSAKTFGVSGLMLGEKMDPEDAVAPERLEELVLCYSHARLGRALGPSWTVKTLVNLNITCADWNVDHQLVRQAIEASFRTLRSAVIMATITITGEISKEKLES